MRHVLANGVETACEITGEGPPIVLCHGGEADHRNFFNFAPLLAERFTVIAYDQRDSGETRNGPEPYSVADLGRDVGALIAALGYDHAHVFGTSFGGAIAQEAALNCPDRIDRLLLSVTWPGPERPVTDAFFELAMSPKTAEQARAYRQMFFSPGFARDFPDEAEARMQRVMVERTPEQRTRRGQAGAAHDTLTRLPTLRCPTLVLTGAEDRIVTPGTSHRLAALIPGAVLVVLDGVGHATTIENPDKVAAAVIEFIDGG